MATYLDSSVLFVAFPDITNSFSNATTATLSWVLNAYTITFAALLVPAGKLGDRLGLRRALYVGSAIFTLASMVCGLAGSIELLIVARVLQGVGAAVLPRQRARIRPAVLGLGPGRLHLHRDPLL